MKKHLRFPSFLKPPFYKLLKTLYIQLIHIRETIYNSKKLMKILSVCATKNILDINTLKFNCFKSQRN